MAYIQCVDCMHQDPIDEIASFDQNNEILIVTFNQKEIDMFHVPELRQEFEVYTSKKPRQVVIDLKETEFMDSSVLGYLFQLFKSVDDYGGKMRLCNVHNRIDKLLQLCGVGPYFKSYENIERALNDD